MYLPKNGKDIALQSQDNYSFDKSITTMNITIPLVSIRIEFIVDPKKILTLPSSLCSRANNLTERTDNYPHLYTHLHRV